MGVRGLHDYMKRHFHQNYVPYKLRDSYLVIDGNNIVYHLYGDSNLRTQFGGEYLAFEVVIEDFIKKLWQCSVEPIFVFDGLQSICKLPNRLARKERELKTVLDFQNQMISASDADALPYIPEMIPHYLVSCLVRVLECLGVRHVTAEGEAEQAAVALAIQLGCPIMSSHSDFLIMCPYWSSSSSVDEGFCFLQLDRCEMGAPIKIGKRGGFYFRCEKYTPEKGLFRNLMPVMRPLFAVLCGNDFIPPGYFDERMPFDTGQNAGGNIGMKTTAKFQGILKWLSSYGSNIDGAVKTLFDQFPNHEKATAKAYLIKAISIYALNIHDKTFLDALGLKGTCQIAKKPQNNVGPIARILQPDGGGHATSGINLFAKWPPHLVASYRKGTFDAHICAALYTSANVFGVVLENMHSLRNPASFIAVQMRRLAYAILAFLEGSRLRQLPSFQDDAVCITEFHRQKHDFSSILITLPLIPELPQYRVLEFLQKYAHLPSKPDTLNDEVYGAGCLLLLCSLGKTRDFYSDAVGLAVASTFIALKSQLLANGNRKKALIFKMATNTKALNTLNSSLLGLDFDVLQDLGEITECLSNLSCLLCVLKAICSDYTIGDSLLLPCLSSVYSSGHYIHQLAQRLATIPFNGRPTEACVWAVKLSRSFSYTDFLNMTSWINESLPNARKLFRATGGVFDGCKQVNAEVNDIVLKLLKKEHI